MKWRIGQLKVHIGTETWQVDRMSFLIVVFRLVAFVFLEKYDNVSVLLNTVLVRT